MKGSVLLLSLAMTAPAWAAIQIDTGGIKIDSNGIRINVDDQNEMQKWKDKHKGDCSFIDIGSVRVASDGCSDKDKEHWNRSVHSGNNPGKGHDKSYKGNEGGVKIELYDDDGKSKGKGKNK